MTPLYRCPFCGGQAMLEHFENLRQGKKECFVRCYTVPCSVMGPVRYTDDEAVWAWNTRAIGDLSPPQQQE